MNQIYIAYGSNLNLRQMKMRCPTAKVMGVGELKNYELLFRGSRHSAVATVEPLDGSSVPVLLWNLKHQDEQALDRYEGWPNFYRKEIKNITLSNKTVPAMVYVMNDGHELGAPSDYYLQTIREGYQSAGFDLEFLDNAVEQSIALAGLQDELQQEQSGFNEQDPGLFSMKWW